MKRVLHVSTECYPAAKAGGMGDVVGALPKYFPEQDIQASVVIPRYDLPWFQEQPFVSVYQGLFYLGLEPVQYEILALDSGILGYPFYCVNIPGKFDRNSVYLADNGEGFRDELQRNISFQRAVLHWLNDSGIGFDLVHCHDHQAGLIPFFMKHGYEFKRLRRMPSYLTIHNAAHHGLMPWSARHLLPDFHDNDGGLLEWDSVINSLAAAIKCCWRFSTVSPNYLTEIQDRLPSLNTLLKDEWAKSRGILNGIDTTVWNPRTDPKIKQKLGRSWKQFKGKNRDYTCRELGLDPDLPLFVFIGRLAQQKGADLIPPAIEEVLARGGSANFIILGTGSKDIEAKLQECQQRHDSRVKSLLMYSEDVAHQLYASADFLLMPSRFEPCGLNQMFSMYYGTIPIVRSTGGLIDTVKDIGEKGCGIRFNDATSSDLANAIVRGLMQYADQKGFAKLIRKCAKQDNSWQQSISIYAEEYRMLWSV